MGQPPVLTSSNPLSTLQQRFVCARLSQSCLPESCSGFAATFTTVAFDHSSLRWLEINTCLPTSKGPPSSLVQLHTAVWTGDTRDTRPKCDIGPNQHLRPKLVQARAAEALQIVLPVGVLLDRHLVCDPGERNI